MVGSAARNVRVFLRVPGAAKLSAKPASAVNHIFRIQALRLRMLRSSFSLTHTGHFLYHRRIVVFWPAARIETVAAGTRLGVGDSCGIVSICQMLTLQPDNVKMFSFILRIASCHFLKIIFQWVENFPSNINLIHQIRQDEQMADYTCDFRLEAVFLCK